MINTLSWVVWLIPPFLIILSLVILIMNDFTNYITDKANELLEYMRGER